MAVRLCHKFLIKQYTMEINFTTKQHLRLENSFGVIRTQKDVELDVTIGIGDHSYFELYDLETGGEEWYAEGSLEIDDKRVLGYDGVFELPTFIIDKLNELGYNTDEVN